MIRWRRLDERLPVGLLGDLVDSLSGESRMRATPRMQAGHSLSASVATFEVLVAAVDGVPGELIESRGDWSLVQPSTVPPPLVRIERYWCHRSVNSRLRQASFQPRMRSMAIKVMLKIEQLRLEIGRRPE